MHAAIRRVILRPERWWTMHSTMSYFEISRFGGDGVIEAVGPGSNLQGLFPNLILELSYGYFRSRRALQISQRTLFNTISHRFRQSAVLWQAAEETKS